MVSRNVLSSIAILLARPINPRTFYNGMKISSQSSSKKPSPSKGRAS
jgi:hypothetical protein